MNKIVASLAHATNEVTLAAANLNLDFTLFKFEAPATYQAFGEQLSLQRKEEAEHGSTHITARKLGALFKGTLPKTPLLVKMYGIRVSEILPIVQTDNDCRPIQSMFQHQLGADGTTIWAAATSGDGAVPVHLLACLLARAWTGYQSTAIWAQLVCERKKEIESLFAEGSLEDYPTLAACRQEITREQLAEWDASARAWIRAADEVKNKELNELRLIINNLDVNVDDSSTFYRNVTRVWHTSMQTMENLLSGQSQTIYNGATLLGISAWHILPNIISFRPSTMEVKHNDPLVPSGGVLTIGLEYVLRGSGQHELSMTSVDSDDHLGVFWSLSLSHLNFYGPPVSVSNSLGVDSTRVGFDQFMLAALGSLSMFLGGTLAQSARFLNVIWNLLEAESTSLGGGASGKAKRTANLDHMYQRTDQTSVDNMEAAKYFVNLKKCNWVKLLDSAATALLEAEGLDLDVAVMLANCGRRRGKHFWSELEHRETFLGFCHPPIFIPLLRDTETQIEVLRSMSKKIRLPAEDTEGVQKVRLIRYPAPIKFFSDPDAIIWEVATVEPVALNTAKRLADGTEVLRTAHRRFIIVERTLQSLVGEDTNDRRLDHNLVDSPPCFCPDGCKANEAGDRRMRKGVCPCKSRNLQCSRACHLGVVRLCNREPQRIDNFLERRLKEIATLGEVGCIVPGPRLRNENDGDDVEEREFFFTEPSNRAVREFGVLAGSPRHACLYQLKDARTNQRRPPTTQPEISYEDMMTLFSNRQFSIPRLLRYIHIDPSLESGRMVSRSTALVNAFSSLQALACVGDIYRLLPSTAVSMGTIQYRGLHKAPWLPKRSEASHTSNLTRLEAFTHPLLMTRAQTFSCLALFETGNLEVSPAILNNVFAMASGDSLFICNTLLCDPFEIPNKHEVTRTLGNIGKPGLAMLIAPESPLSRDISIDDWKFITNAPFRGEPFDGFKATSMHLSFSGYKAPLISSRQGSQDVDAYLIEAILSVYSGSKWIGDVNVLKAVESTETVVRMDQIQGCGHAKAYDDSFYFITFDSWDEVLEGADDVAVARSHKNWQARLALTCIAAQRGSTVLVLPNAICWKCLHNFIRQSDLVNNKAVVIVM
ncbi:hypothetical protein F4680DRAFT_404705 [Xylaria scruposa]|nr:hypothetical protein F4680DRAFT_404705 [Xylaria scruposa]